MRLFVWLPRSQPGDIEVSGPPSDSSQREIRLFDGANLASETTLHFTVEQPGVLPDFLYNLRLLMIASDRAMRVIEESLDPSDSVHPVRLVTRNGDFIDSYSWVNLHRRVPLLNEDLVKSVKKTSIGHYVRIDGFSVKSDVVASHDLFICKETGSKIFSEALVERVTSAGLTGGTFTPLEGMDWPF